MERISRDDMYLQMCKVMSQRGSCLRARVACLITRDNRILSSGYNGPPPNEAHCSETNCDINSSCKRAIHAEANAIAFAAKEGIPLKNSTLYCLYSPCPTCAQLILQAGIIRIVYQIEYRDKKGLELLEGSQVLCEQIKVTTDD